jgi:lipopolysaccharide biosynthesis regulator YciM
VDSDWPAVETWLERIVEMDSTDLDVYHALARVYRQQGSIGRAIRMHQNLLLRGDLPAEQRQDALFELARDFDAGGFKERAGLSQELREFPRALTLIKRLRRLDRPVADAVEVSLLVAYAQSQLDEGEHEGARSTVKRCLRRFKTCGAAWELLGQIEVERGKDAKALDAWCRGAVADPEIGAALYPKIEAGFAARGKPRDYWKFLTGILAKRPMDLTARIAVARTLVSRGKSREAIEELSRAIEVAPDHAGLRVELGRELLASGQETEALKAYTGLLDAMERGAFASSSVELAGTRDEAVE